jgi:hypothetical protein
MDGWSVGPTSTQHSGQLPAARVRELSRTLPGVCRRMLPSRRALTDCWPSSLGRSRELTVRTRCSVRTHDRLLASGTLPPTGQAGAVPRSAGQRVHPGPSRDVMTGGERRGDRLGVAADNGPGVRSGFIFCQAVREGWRVRCHLWHTLAPGRPTFVRGHPPMPPRPPPRSQVGCSRGHRER